MSFLGDMMRASGDMESIWNTIPNVSSKPFCSSRYGDHLGNNFFFFLKFFIFKINIT